MSLRLTLAIALLTSSFSTAATAQEAAPDPDARRLRPGTDSLAIYLVRGSDTTRTGTMRDELTVITHAGQPALRRVYTSADRVLGARLDTIVDRLADLRPLAHRSRSTRTTEHLDYAAGRVTGWLRLVNGDSVGVDAPAATAFNSSTLDLVLRTSTLRDGWAVSVPVFVPTTRTVVPLRARVTGVEPIGGDACWRVLVDFMGTPVTFWVSQTSRALRQQVMQVRPDVQVLFRRAVPDAGGRRAA